MQRRARGGRVGGTAVVAVALLLSGCADAPELAPPDLAADPPAEDAPAEDAPEQDVAEGDGAASDDGGPDGSTPPASDPLDPPDPEQLRVQLESALAPQVADSHRIACPVTFARFGEHLTCEAEVLSSAPPDTTPLRVFVLFVDDRGGYQSFLHRDGWRGPESMTADVGSQALCRDILEELGSGGEYPQLTLLAYWHHHGRPARMDATGDGIPCQTVIDGMRELALEPEGRLG